MNEANYRFGFIRDETDEELVSDYEGQDLGAVWRDCREYQDKIDARRQVRHTATPADWNRERERKDLLQDLTALDNRIQAAKRAGQNTRRMQKDWLRVLARYEQVCRQIAGLERVA